MMRLPQKNYTPTSDTQNKDPYYDVKLKSKLFIFCEHVVFLVKLNIFAVLLSLVGGVVLGLFPAIQSASDMCKLYVEGSEPPLLSRMWSTYKSCFLCANLVGWSGVTLVILSLYSWFLLASTANTLLTGIGMLFALASCLIALAIFFYGFGISVIYGSSRWFKVVRLSIVLFFAKWQMSLLLGLILGAILLVVLLFPQIGFLVALSSGPCVSYIFVNKMLSSYVGHQPLKAE